MQTFFVSGPLAWLRQLLQQSDKRKHIAWSFALLLAALALLPITGAVALVFAIGLAKECWDAQYGSGFCWLDLLSNCIGMLAALLLALPLLALYPWAINWLLAGTLL